LKIRRFGPRSLAGQMAVMVAIALFCAQAINFGMFLHERRQIRFEQVTLPSITRVVDGVERIAAGRPLPDGDDRGRGRVLLESTNPIPADAEPQRDVEAGIRSALAENGLTTTTIQAVVRVVLPQDPRLRAFGPRRAERFARAGGELIVAVEQPGKGWITLHAPWPRGGGPSVWQLIAQTLILYGAVLIAVLWAGSRMARPLRDLVSAASSFTPGGPVAPLIERGPSDVRAVTGAFNALRTRVTGMLDEKDRMLGAIGHDLRTPLAALRVRIESVEDEGDHDRMAEIIAEMDRTLDDILSLARLGRPSEPPTEVDMAALVEAVVEDFRDLGADVTAEESPRLRMTLRPTLMRRAVRNLIENAVKYGVSVEVTLVQGPGCVRIGIADRGPGIPPDQFEEVFDPFTRLETSRNKDTGGIGLGLALARAIVREAGGDIELANRDGGGLLATIVLKR